MSERFNVDIDDVLGSNYLVTSISCSSYNPTIDGTITLTVTVKDVYGTAVSGESVLVTASSGSFTGYNGSSITSASHKWMSADGKQYPYQPVPLMEPYM